MDAQSMRSLAMPAMGTRLGYVPPVTPPGPWCPEAEIRDNLACRICVDGSQDRRALTLSRGSIEEVDQWQSDMLYIGRGEKNNPRLPASEWGNLFKLSEFSIDESLQRYEAYVRG